MFLDSSDDEEDEPDIPETIKDIDSNSDGIIDVSEYAAEIYQYLKAAEVNILIVICKYFAKGLFAYSGPSSTPRVQEWLCKV